MAPRKTPFFQEELYGMPWPAIARELGLSVPYVHHIYMKAMAKMRAYVREHPEEFGRLRRETILRPKAHEPNINRQIENICV